MESGDFPQHYDLQIPGTRKSGLTANSGQNGLREADIAGALDGDYDSYGRQEETKAVRRSYEASGTLARANQVAEPAEMYMPIKALN